MKSNHTVFNTVRAKLGPAWKGLILVEVYHSNEQPSAAVVLYCPPLLVPTWCYHGTPSTAVMLYYPPLLVPTWYYHGTPSTAVMLYCPPLLVPTWCYHGTPSTAVMLYCPPLLVPTRCYHGTPSTVISAQPQLAVYVHRERSLFRWVKTDLTMKQLDSKQLFQLLQDSRI